MIKLITIVCFMMISFFATGGTSVGYRYSNNYTEPNNPNKVEKHVFNITDVRPFALGSNVLVLDRLESSRDDKSRDDDGATEYYLVERLHLTYGKVFDSPLSFGPVRDTSLTLGFDANDKNTVFAPRKRLFVLGATFHTSLLPRGFLDVTLLANREHNHCGIAPCKAPGNHESLWFDPYLSVGTTWLYPFKVRGVPVKFQGFYTISQEKGPDYTGKQTGTEQLSRSALMMSPAKNFWIGPGYEFWRNKFGNKNVKGGDTNAVTIQLEYQL
jgi:hypothetical protein